MQIAYLKRTVISQRDPEIQTFTLMVGSNANGVATQKARTLLSFLWDRELLSSSEYHDWIMYCPIITNNATATLELLPFLQNASEEVAAIMPVKYMEDSCDQYGVIAVRKDEVTQRTFVNSFLDSSRKWLKTHNKERDKLERRWL